MAVTFTDNFTDTNGTDLTAHTPDLGSAWTTPVGDFEISSNKARSSVLSGGQAIAISGDDATQDDYQIEFTIAGTSGATSDGVIFRATDDNDFLFVGWDGDNSTATIYKCVAGTFTSLGGGPIPTSVPRTVKLLVSGPTVAVFVNDVLVACCESGLNVNSRGFGMRFSGTVAVNTIDSFSVSTLPDKVDEAHNFNTGITKVILDTDYNTDLGDLGALQTLHTLATNGYADILAVTTMVRNADVVNAIYGTNDFYGRPTTPIGVTNKTTFGTCGAEFVAIADTYGTAGPGLATNDAVDLLRSKLYTAPDNSVVLLAIGYLTNISDLLDSTSNNNGDGILMTGVELVTAKVKRFVGQFGLFGYRSDAGSIEGAEYNGGGDATATANVVNTWPATVPFYLHGAELGWPVETSVVSTIAGYTRPMWDQIVVAFGLLGGNFGGVNYWNTNKADIYYIGGQCGYKHTATGLKYVVRPGTASAASTAAFIKNLCEGGAFPDFGSPIVGKSFGLQF